MTKLHKMISSNILYFKQCEFFKHGKNYITTLILTNGLYVISLPILTRLLTPDDFGILGVFVSLVSLLNIIFGFGVVGAIGRFYYEKDSNIYSFLKTNLVFMWFAGVVLLLLLVCFKDNFSYLLAIPVSVVLYGGLISFFNASIDAIQSYLQASKQSFLLSKIVFIRTLFTVSLTIILTYLLVTERYFGTVYSQLTLTSIFFVLFVFALYKKTKREQFSLSHLKYSLLFGFPIVIHLLSGYILNSFDQIMINGMVGEYETGLYNFAYRIAALFQICLFGLHQAWGPQFNQMLLEKQFDKINLMAKYYSLLISFISVILVIFSPIGVKIFGPIEYHSALNIIPIIVIGFLFQFLYMIFVNYAFYEKKTISIAIITTISGAVNIVSNYYLIPVCGFQVAAFTTVLGYSVLFILHYVNVSYIIKPEYLIPMKSVFPFVFVSILFIFGFWISII